ncbi:MAG: alpha/beta hydrolase [bacterium]
MRRGRPRARIRAAALVLLAAALLFLFLRSLPPARHPLDAALLLQALLAGEEKSWLKGWGAAPMRREADFPDGVMDLYTPAGGDEAPSPRGCILLAHGMTDRGRRDPRIAAFARALARLGFAAAVPELEGMKRFRPEAADISRIESAFGRLTRLHGGAARPCGLFAFSFAAGPALKAAARPGLRGRVGYLIAFGAYYDLRAVLRGLTTGGRGEEPAFPGGPPVRAGKWLFLRYNTDLLGLAGHEAVAAEIVRRKLADEAADIGPLLARLPEGPRRVIALMENRDPARFEALYAGQPAALRERVARWSVGEEIVRTRMPLFLLHGRGDPFIPPSESVRLAEAARGRPPGSGKVRLLIVERFAHVDPKESAGGWGDLWEAARLLGFISEILTAMEGG